MLAAREMRGEARTNVICFCLCFNAFVVLLAFDIPRNKRKKFHAIKVIAATTTNTFNIFFPRNFIYLLNIFTIYAFYTFSMALARSVTRLSAAVVCKNGKLLSIWCRAKNPKSVPLFRKTLFGEYLNNSSISAAAAHQIYQINYYVLC